MSTKIRIEIADGVIQGICATAPVSIQFVDHDFPDGHNATYDDMDVVTWWKEIDPSDVITDEQFALGLIYTESD